MMQKVIGLHDDGGRKMRFRLQQIEGQGFLGEVARENEGKVEVFVL